MDVMSVLAGEEVQVFVKVTVEVGGCVFLGIVVGHLNFGLFYAVFYKGFISSFWLLITCH